MPTTLEEIVEKDILEILGMHNLSDETKADLYTQLYKTLQNLVITRIADILEPADFKYLVNILDAGHHEEIAQFFKEHNLDMKRLFAEEAVSLKLQMAAYAKAKEESKGKENGGSTNA